MKSLYFTSKEIDTQAEELLDQIEMKNSRPREWQRPALLVLDLQEYFLSPDSHAFVPAAQAIIPGILRLIESFRKLGFPVIFSRHINRKEDAGVMDTWWRELITVDHPLAGLIKPLKSYEPDAVIKTQYDAFYATDLHKRLEVHHVTDVVITGVMTHLCCETTARSAFVRGYQVWFPVDGTATYNLDFHMGSLRNLAHGFARIPLMKDLVRFTGSQKG